MRSIAIGIAALALAGCNATMPQQQRQFDQQQFMNGMMMMQMGMPQPVQQATPMNCRTRNVNGVLHTNCW